MAICTNRISWVSFYHTIQTQTFPKTWFFLYARYSSSRVYFKLDFPYHMIPLFIRSIFIYNVHENEFSKRNSNFDTQRNRRRINQTSTWLLIHLIVWNAVIASKIPFIIQCNPFELPNSSVLWLNCSSFFPQSNFQIRISAQLLPLPSNLFHIYQAINYSRHLL